MYRLIVCLCACVLVGAFVNTFFAIMRFMLFAKVGRIKNIYYTYNIIPFFYPFIALVIFEILAFIMCYFIGYEALFLIGAVVIALVLLIILLPVCYLKKGFLWIKGDRLYISNSKSVSLSELKECAGQMSPFYHKGIVVFWAKDRYVFINVTIMGGGYDFVRYLCEIIGASVPEMYKKDYLQPVTRDEKNRELFQTIVQYEKNRVKSKK